MASTICTENCTGLLPGRGRVKNEVKERSKYVQKVHNEEDILRACKA